MSIMRLIIEKSIQIELNNNYIAEKSSQWAHQSETTPNSQSKEQVWLFHILFTYFTSFIILELADM